MNLLKKIIQFLKKKEEPKAFYTNCRCCGKTLTDPISISLGFGPVCRANKKNKSLNERTLNMFAERAEYSYTIDGNIIAIEDLQGMKSVTNDIENVLRDIINENQLVLDEYQVIYKDSFGVWDGVHMTGSRYSFYSINEREYKKARLKIVK